jgi:hypothetical protein
MRPPKPLDARQKFVPPKQTRGSPSCFMNRHPMSSGLEASSRPPFGRSHPFCLLTMRSTFCAAASPPGAQTSDPENSMQRPRRRTLSVQSSIPDLLHGATGACLLGRRRTALPGQQRPALRHRPHRIRPQPAGRRPQRQRLARHRADADQLRLAAHAGGSTASMSAICSSPAPTSMSVPGFSPAMSPASATPGTPSAPTTHGARPCAVPMPRRCAATCLPLSPPLQLRREERLPHPCVSRPCLDHE